MLSLVLGLVLTYGQMLSTFAISQLKQAVVTKKPKKKKKQRFDPVPWRGEAIWKSRMGATLETFTWICSYRLLGTQPSWLFPAILIYTAHSAHGYAMVPWKWPGVAMAFGEPKQMGLPPMPCGGAEPWLAGSTDEFGPSISTQTEPRWSGTIRRTIKTWVAILLCFCLSFVCVSLIVKRQLILW